MPRRRQLPSVGINLQLRSAVAALGTCEPRAQITKRPILAEAHGQGEHVEIGKAAAALAARYQRIAVGQQVAKAGRAPHTPRDAAGRRGNAAGREGEPGALAAPRPGRSEPHRSTKATVLSRPEVPQS
jgi:hypothetical protein